MLPLRREARVLLGAVCAPRLVGNCQCGQARYSRSQSRTEARHQRQTVWSKRGGGGGGIEGFGPVSHLPCAEVIGAVGTAGAPSG